MNTFEHCAVVYEKRIFGLFRVRRCACFKCGARMKDPLKGGRCKHCDGIATTPDGTRFVADHFQNPAARAREEGSE